MIDDKVTSELQNQPTRPVRKYEGIGALLGAMAGAAGSVAVWYYDKTDYNTAHMMLWGELTVLGAIAGGVIEDRMRNWYREFQDYRRE